jgi:hypothetical protein
MAFMQPQYIQGKWLQIETDAGTWFIPEDLGMDPADCVEGEITEDPEVITGVGVRLSAPGYMDCTDWCVFDTMTEARNYLVETWEVDPDTGDSLEDSYAAQ